MGGLCSSRGYIRAGVILGLLQYYNTRGNGKIYRLYLELLSFLVCQFTFKTEVVTQPRPHTLVLVGGRILTIPVFKLKNGKFPYDFSVP